MGRMTWQEAERHAGRLLRTPTYGGVYEAAIKVMPHYIFTTGDEKHRQGWCSACQQWVDCSREIMREQFPGWVNNDPYLADDDVEQPFIPFAGESKFEFDRWYGEGSTRHNTTGYCPRCGARVRFRSLARGYRSQWDKRFLIRYAKSEIDPQNAVVCVGYRLDNEWRRMDENNLELPLRIAPLEMCVFRYGQGGERFIHEYKWCGVGGWEPQWAHRQMCVGGFVPGMYSNTVQTVLDANSFWEAIAGTPFAMSARQGGEIWHIRAAMDYDRITIMDALARFPCLEYLFKLDQDEIACAAIDHQIGNRINRRGKTAREVLRLTADEWGEVKGKQLSLTPDALDVRRVAHQKKWRMNMELIAWCGRHRGGYENVLKIHQNMPGADLPRMVKYCKSHNVPLRDYADHVAMMKTLGMTAQDREFLLPRSFADSHHELSTRLDNVKNAGKTVKMAERISSGSLDGYFFSAVGLTLRPAFSAAEIVAEGNYLKHCVGGYVGRYAEGFTVICFLRDDSDLKKPRYTVEFATDGRLLQCRGYKNDREPEAQAQREADEERLKLFWKLHSLYRADLAKQKKHEKRRRNAT